MTARVFDKPPVRYWDHWLDDREAHVYTIGHRGRRAPGGDPGHRPELSKQEAGTGSYDISPDGTEIAFAADSDPTGTEPNSDVYVVPAEGGKARNLTAGEQGRRRRAALQPRRTVPRLRSAGGAGLLRGSGAPRPPRPQGGHEPRPHRGLRPLGGRPRVGARRGGPLRHRGRRGPRPRVQDRRGHRRPHADHEGAQLLLARPVGATARSCSPCARASPSRPPSCAWTPPRGRPPSSAPSTTRSSRRWPGGRYESVTYKGCGREGHPDVGELPAGVRQDEEVAGVPDPARRTAQRGHRQLHLPLERAGVLGLGLRDRLAQLPRLLGLRAGLHRLDQPRLGHQALRGHDRGRKVAGRPALGRPRPYGRGRGQLRRLPRHPAPRAAAPLQDPGGPRGRLQPLQHDGLRRRGQQAALRRVLGEGAGPPLPEDVARTSRRATSRPRPW